MLVADVQEIVQERVEVPIEEQHLYAGGRELKGDDALSGLDGSPLLLMRWETDPLTTDLGHFHVATNFQPLPHSDFQRVSKIADGLFGGVYKYAWCHEGLEDCVAVKKSCVDALRAAREREPVERTVHLEGRHKSQGTEDPLAEIGILRYLARQPDLSPHLVRLRGVFAEDRHAWVVMEYADGGELFGIAASGPVDEGSVRRYTWHLTQAVAYLHRHGIGHRDVSLENVLLRDGRAQLADFGQSVRSCSPSGVPLRFFRMAGKDYNRAPEVYVPRAAQARAIAPEGLPRNRVAMARSAGGYLSELKFPPEAVPGEACQAEVWGYAAAPADVFAVGICLFILAWQCPPWHRALMMDRSFHSVYRRGDSGLVDLLRAWQRPLLSPEAMQVLSEMLRIDPAQRPSAAACLDRPWFAAADSA